MDQQKNILYYDAIAARYNDMLDKTADKIVRQKVADKFCSIVKSGTVLDFGGGTGLDMEWLTANKNKIFFCEPSKKMRETAIKSAEKSSTQIIFLEGIAADFRHWQKQLPFVEKMDAVLADFAVFNCIPDIELMFQNIALVLNSGGNIIAVVLTKKPQKILKGLRFFLRRVFFGLPESVNIKYQNHGQTVYLYSVNEIIKASKKYFNFCSSEILQGSDFTLIHLARK